MYYNPLLPQRPPRLQNARRVLQAPFLLCDGQLPRVERLETKVHALLALQSQVGIDKKALLAAEASFGHRGILRPRVLAIDLCLVHDSRQRRQFHRLPLQQSTAANGRSNNTHVIILHCQHCIHTYARRRSTMNKKDGEHSMQLGRLTVSATWHTCLRVAGPFTRDVAATGGARTPSIT